GVAHASTVRFVFEEIIPFGKSRYAAMFAAVWLPVVVPGKMTVVPLSVAPVPRTTTAAPAMLSVKLIPAGALPAVPLKDQRLTRAAGAGAHHAIASRSVQQASF